MPDWEPLPAPPRALPAGDGLRPGICRLLCELYLQEVVPETVLHDCLEQLLWDVRGCRGC